MGFMKMPWAYECNVYIFIDRCVFLNKADMPYVNELYSKATSVDIHIYVCICLFNIFTYICIFRVVFGIYIYIR